VSYTIQIEGVNIPLVASCCRYYRSCGRAVVFDLPCSLFLFGCRSLISKMFPAQFSNLMVPLSNCQQAKTVRYFLPTRLLQIRVTVSQAVVLHYQDRPVCRFLSHIVKRYEFDSKTFMLLTLTHLLETLPINRSLDNWRNRFRN
jgi:hypothetical protein